MGLACAGDAVRTACRTTSRLPRRCSTGLPGSHQGADTTAPRTWSGLRLRAAPGCPIAPGAAEFVATLAGLGAAEDGVPVQATKNQVMPTLATLRQEAPCTAPARLLARAAGLQQGHNLADFLTALDARTDTATTAQGPAPARWSGHTAEARPASSPPAYPHPPPDPLPVWFNDSGTMRPAGLRSRRERRPPEARAAGRSHRHRSDGRPAAAPRTPPQRRAQPVSHPRPQRLDRPWPLFGATASTPVRR